MIKVIVGNNAKREPVMLTPDTTLRAAFDMKQIDYAGGQIHLDGSTIGPGDMNKTFSDFGFDGSEGHDRCFLLNVAKADNA